MKEVILKVAILSMYPSADAQGIINIKQLLERESGKYKCVKWECTVFDVRFANHHPDPADFDVYISTGGPGDPHDGEGEEWERLYFQFLDRMYRQDFPDKRPKFLFSICHSFQLLCRHFGIAAVTKRKGNARFGVFPSSKQAAGKNDALFNQLPDPFLMVENRSWQCILVEQDRLNRLGIKVLATENQDPASALLALRITPNWIGTQFHPEAGISSMQQQHSSRKEAINLKHGEGKWEELMKMLESLNPSLDQTHETLLPHFLQTAADLIISNQ